MTNDGKYGVQIIAVKQECPEAEENEISARRFRGQLHPVFLCATFCCTLAMAVDAVNRAKPAANHTDVLGVGQYWRFNASNLHSSPYNSVQP